MDRLILTFLSFWLICASAVQATGRRFTMTVAGESGSGKSETGQALAEALGERGIRATVLRTIKDVELIVPNSNLLTDVVTNYSRGENRAIRLEIQVFAYHDRDPHLVREAMMAAADRIEGLVDDPLPYVEFQAFGADRTNEFTLEVWIEDIWDFDEISSDLRFYIWEEMQKRDLHFPPIQYELFTGN